MRVSAAADPTGMVTAKFAPRSLAGGDALALSNGARTLTTLHVAHLRVSIVARRALLSGGTCQAGSYYGAPLSDAPINMSAGGPGVALTGMTCPLSGHAAGLPTDAISQTDELSGGQTQTEVPDIENTSPLQGETVYGRFIAVARSGLPEPDHTTAPTNRTSTIALRIVRAGGRVVFHAHNVDTRRGVRVPALRPGLYRARWTLSDANGDTRILITRFVEQAGIVGTRSR